MDEANVTALAQVDEDVEVISPQPKKQRQPTISWTDEVTDALLSYVYMTKPWGAKKITQAYDVVAASLNTHCDEFKNVTISGANVKSRVEKAVASYVGTYLSEGSNKSGFDGDKDSEDNYSNVMLWAKKIHEEMENMAKV